MVTVGILAFLYVFMGVLLALTPWIHGDPMLPPAIFVKVTLLWPLIMMSRKIRRWAIGYLPDEP